MSITSGIASQENKITRNNQMLVVTELIVRPSVPSSQSHSTTLSVNEA